MAKPGRRPGTPAEWRAAFLRRTADLRIRAQLSHAEIAAVLTEAVGRVISVDSYRKWESESLMPHDVIMPFCDVTVTHPYELFGVAAVRGGTAAIAAKKSGKGPKQKAA